MSKTFRPYTPEQSELLPPSPREWLPEEHVAYFVLDTVAELDLSVLMAKYERELRGYPPYHPRMMVALLLYGYCVGVASSRKIERRTYEDIAFRVIAGGQHPDHTVISEFRRKHLDLLAGLFMQVLALCQKAGAGEAGARGVGRHEAEGERQQAQGDELRADAAAGEGASERRWPRCSRPQRKQTLLKTSSTASGSAATSCPRTCAGQRVGRRKFAPRKRRWRPRRKRHARLRKPRRRRTTQMTSHLLARRRCRPIGCRATLTARRHRRHNGTSPTPRAGFRKTKDGFIQGFNGQAAVDEENQVIVAVALTNQPPDAQHFIPMLEQVVENCGDVPKVTTADAGYFSEENILRAAAMGIDAYVATGRDKHGADPPLARGRMPADLSVKGWMQRRLRTKGGRKVYARRKAVAEPPFGQIKQARGFRQLLLRGLEKARGEWQLICLTHNLLKLHRAQLA